MEIQKQIQVQTQATRTVFPFVTGIEIASLLITLLRSFYCKFSLPYIGLISLFIRNIFTQLLSHWRWSISFPGYNLIRADNPKNIKREEVCIFDREILPLKINNVNFLNDCLVCELSFESCRVCSLSIYRTPSQSNNEYDTNKNIIKHQKRFI